MDNFTINLFFLKKKSSRIDEGSYNRLKIMTPSTYFSGYLFVYIIKHAGKTDIRRRWR